MIGDDYNHYLCFDLVHQAGHLRLVKPYMIAVQSNNVSAVNTALNEIYVEEEDYDRLRESIDLHDNFDQIGLAQKVCDNILCFFTLCPCLFYVISISWGIHCQIVD